ncbi:MAG: KilA-N domain-containing protein [Synergistaceae bacterium]|nr:KilA-N domain-containing protein [Synergistaceae bacterium]
MLKKETVTVRGTEISVLTHRHDDYISLTDIAKYKDEQNPRFVIQNWMRNRNTVEFLGIWELLYNTNFNRVGFEAVRTQAGLNSFVLTPQKWIETTGALSASLPRPDDTAGTKPPLIVWQNSKLRVIIFLRIMRVPPFFRCPQTPEAHKGGLFFIFPK